MDREESKQSIINQDPRSRIVREFSRYTEVAAPQIDSFNQFLQKAKDEVINRVKFQFDNGHSISFSDAEILNPSMASIDQSKKPLYPSVCRARDLTYKGDVNAKAVWRDENGEVLGIAQISLPEMPIMLQSSACNLRSITPGKLRDVLEDKDDPFGYFIVQGQEKAIVMQERAAPNVLLSYQDSSDKVTSNNQLPVTIVTDMKCVAPSGRKVKVAVRLMKKTDDDLGQVKRPNATSPIIKVVLPSFPEETEINVCAIFGVLGMMTEDPTFFQNQDNIQAYVLDWVPKEHQSIVAAYMDYTTNAYSMYSDNPIGYVAEKLLLSNKGMTVDQMSKEVFRQVADNLFVNMNEYQDKDHPYEKHLEMLAYVVARHILVLTGIRGRSINPIEASGIRDVNDLIKLGLDDRADDSNKIIDTAGSLCMFLYVQIFEDMIRRAGVSVNDRLGQPDLLSELNTVMNRTLVRDAMTRAIRTGEWGMSNKIKHKGITRTLQRASIVGAIADVRSINSPIPRESKDVVPRSVHISTWGFICPTSTKEGENCGLSKSLAQGANVTVASDPRLVYDLFMPNRRYIDDPSDGSDTKLYLTRQRDMLHDTPVFINGGFVGFCIRDELRGEFIASRREHALPSQVSIRLDLDGSLQIHTEAGWFVRPLLVVDVDQKLLVDKEGLWGKSWSEILQKGAAEYVTASEQADLLIASFPRDLGQALMGPDPNIPATYQEERDPTITHIPQYTHLELDPALLFSEEANTVPFPTNNPGTRPTYASNMAKHLVGVYHSAHRGMPATREIPAHGDLPAIPAQPAIPGRFESSKVLAYPQKPLVYTDTYVRSDPEITDPSILEKLAVLSLSKSEEEITAIRSRLADATNNDMFGIVGNMATVAILGAIPEANDEEDAIMLNRGFIDRGGFMSTTYKADEYEIDNPDTEKFGIPPNLKDEEVDLYSAIDPVTGIARVGSVLRPGMAIIAKYSETDNGSEARNTSIFLKSADTLTPLLPLKVAPFNTKGQKIRDVDTNELRYETREEYDQRVARVRSVLSTSISNEPIMDDVFTGRSGAGKTFVKWKYRITRRPQVGDKFTSRFSQKGVVGAIFASEDMPFSAQTGVAPDIAVNKHGYITRMTIGQMLESITGKAASSFGTRLNATAFRDVNNEELRRIMRENGFNYNGSEPYIDGITGQMLDASVFVGPVYYQVQKHMVEEKRHGRALGAVHPLYRQPPEGKQRNGGLRLGEMERPPMKQGSASSTIKVGLVRRYASNTCQIAGITKVHLINTMKEGA